MTPGLELVEGIWIPGVPQAPHAQSLVPWSGRSPSPFREASHEAGRSNGKKGIPGKGVPGLPRGWMWVLLPSERQRSRDGPLLGAMMRGATPRRRCQGRGVGTLCGALTPLCPARGPPFPARTRQLTHCYSPGSRPGSLPEGRGGAVRTPGPDTCRSSRDPHTTLTLEGSPLHVYMTAARSAIPCEGGARV